ncbi:MAG: glycosyltransferase family 2 protein [Microgenomates group bacterium]|jgi:dolichol-phosphate mannosyltransferase
MAKILTKRKISAIIACYKDGQAVPFMYSRLVKVFSKIKIDYEIIFVNDGSPDDTENILEKLAKKDKKVVAINHSRNFGSQMAFSSGMEIATGDAVVLLDGDLQDPPELIEKFYGKWLEGYDVIYGIRVKREATTTLQICYKLFYRIFQKLSYIKIPVDAGDFSLIDRNVVEVLNNMPEKDRFLRGLRAWVGFNQTGIPYTRPERMFGKTTNNWHKNFGWARKGIFSFSYVPLEMITYISMFVVFFSFVGIVIQVILRLLYPQSPRGISLIVVLTLFLGGIQLLGISILGEYIGKIFEEVKNRPKYIVKSIFNKPIHPKRK